MASLHELVAVSGYRGAQGAELVAFSHKISSRLPPSGSKPARVPREPECVSSARYFVRLKVERTRLLCIHCERSELDEVVASSARAELRPRLIALLKAA